MEKKKTYVLSVRIDEDEYNYLNMLSDVIQVKPAQCIRLLIDKSMIDYKNKENSE